MSKSSSNGSTSYRYDGQMGTEDIDFASNGSVSKVTDYGLRTWDSWHRCNIRDPERYGVRHLSVV